MSVFRVVTQAVWNQWKLDLPEDEKYSLPQKCWSCINFHTSSTFASFWGSWVHPRPL